MRQMSIRTKLVLILSILLVLAFFSTSLISYLVSKNHFRSGVLNQTLPLISNNILSDIQNDLMMPIYVSSLMANDTFLKDWSVGGEKNIDEITKYLQEISKKYGFFTAFFVSDRTSKYYYYGGVLKSVSIDDNHDVWYYGFKDKNVDMELDVDTDEASAGNLAIFINHRLLDYQGRFLGVAGVGLNMKQIGGILADYQKKYDCTVYLTDSSGLIQVHPDQSLIEKVSMADLEGLREIAREILKKKSDSESFEYTRNGRQVYLSARYFPSFDWYLVVEQKEDDTLQDIRSVLFTNTAVGLLASGLILVIVVLTVNYFQRRMEVLATVDELTQIANRRQLMSNLKAESIRAGRHHHQYSLLMIDADHFKSINDNYGHQTGDQALVMLAETIQASLRASDMLGRLGGEEFVAILPETDLDEAVLVAERIRRQVESTVLSTEHGQLNLTVSIGAATTEDGTAETEQLLHLADQAMYQAKESGRNRVVTAS